MAQVSRPGGQAMGSTGEGTLGQAAAGAASGVTPRRPRALTGRALAFAAGTLPVLTFPKPALWWLAYGVLIPLLLVLRSAPTAREALVRGWLGGAGFIFAVHHWLLPNLLVFLPVVALAVGLAWAPWGWLVWRVLSGPVTAPRALAAVVLIPCGWLVIELLRSWQSLGGPWGLLGASQWQVPLALDLAALGGVWLVSLVVVAVNVALLAAAVANPGGRAVAAGAVGCVAAASLGWAAVKPSPAPDTSGRSTVTVAAIQPGVMAGPERRLAAEERITRSVEGRHPDLIVWGESSVGFDLTARPQVAEQLSALAEQAGADLLVNVDARRSDRPGIYKSTILVTPRGLAGRYDKMRLVPFGEYIPFRPVLGWLSHFTEAAAENRRRGTHLVVLDAGGLRVGPLVCFESAFPDMSRHLAARGTQLLVFQSSTSTFQDSWAPEQHASLAALRAAETGRPVLHATLTGTTTAFDASGRRIGRPLSTRSSGALVVSVPLTSGRTPFVRFGDWIPVLAVTVLIGAGVTQAAMSYRAARPARRSAPRVPHGQA
jgi:apolipoprotein N-acyltransferase